MKRTVLYDCHVECGGRIVDFAGWEMPVQYATGILQEHLATRKGAGLFEVSHMGRFEIRGGGAEAFLRDCLTHDARHLPVGFAHYTLLANERGGAIDDAFLYRFTADTRLLVVNASNAEKDWSHLKELAGAFSEVELKDVSGEVAMIALQGPCSEAMLADLLEEGCLPEPKRNALGQVRIAGAEVKIGRTGYTGEPVCFELFIPAESAGGIWTLLVEKGARPVGLGARDTLRLEASLPLYGHEYGTDPAGEEIPILACPTAKFGVDLSDPDRRFVGREAIEKQTQGIEKMIRPVRVTGKGLARAGAAVFYEGKPAGWLTSGTMVPYWEAEGEGTGRKLTERTGQRAIGLALVDSGPVAGAAVEIEVRGRRVAAEIVKKNLDNRSGPVTFAVL